MTRLSVLGLLLFAASVALAQDTPGGYTAYLPNQKVSIDDLPAVKALSKDAGDVMLAAVQTILHDKALCCGNT
jgi:hypothetical protein